MTTNELTSAILNFLAERQHCGMRINTQGQWDPKKGIWRKSGSTKGVADIHAVIQGRHVSIEIKTGNDKQSQVQTINQHLIERAGGKYWIVKDWLDFIDKYENIV